jgi:diguanylate cyclase (GGDEF)-like protein/PAS domain S-box-containing protein
MVGTLQIPVIEMIQRGSLLIVDDSEPNRNALSRLLALKGYLVTTAGDGDEALALAAAGAYDLVLLDVDMPGMTGLEVLSRLRDTHSQTALPVIMVTGRTGGDDIVEAFRLGANDYVTKPIDFPVALARLGTHLSHKWAVEDLRESEERYALAVRGANDGLWDWNLTTNEVYWSPRWKQMLGYDESAIGVSPDEWLTRVHHKDAGRVKAALAAHLADASGFYESEHRILHRNGTFRWVLCRGAAVRDRHGAVTRLAGSLTDITDAKVADALTGLPNRLLFVDLIERAIKRTQRHRDCTFALLTLGLDRFEAVNHSLGRLTTDCLLVAIANRLQSSLRTTDAVTHQRGSTLARLGGDEFTVLLEDINDASDAIRVSDRLRLALDKPFDVDGHQVFVSATVGITVSTTGYVRAEDVLQDAAIALHRAKASGTTPYELFDPAMRERAVSRLQVETDLRNAIDNREFAVMYQPIISVETGTISGFEALVRWRHPTRGLLCPAEFIPIAEDTGMIGQIGRLVLIESCRQMVAWQRRFGPDAPRVVCVNVSGKQLAHVDLASDIEAILRDTGLGASSLQLEITESAYIGDVIAAETTLKRMQSIGIEWSIDDFGTGYSSLSYLHRLRADTVKVDRSFVSRIGSADNGSEMVCAIVALARNLGMDVVAEGVETAEQLSEIEALGCEFVQGFYFSRPVDVAAAGDLIASQPWRECDARVSSKPLALLPAKPAYQGRVPVGQTRS